MEILSHLTIRMKEDFKPYLSSGRNLLWIVELTQFFLLFLNPRSVLSPTIDRMGDSKDSVREYAKTLLMKLINFVSTAQVTKSVFVIQSLSKLFFLCRLFSRSLFPPLAIKIGVYVKRCVSFFKNVYFDTGWLAPPMANSMCRNLFPRLWYCCPIRIFKSVTLQWPHWSKSTNMLVINCDMKFSVNIQTCHSKSMHFFPHSPIVN